MWALLLLLLLPQASLVKGITFTIETRSNAACFGWTQDQSVFFKFVSAQSPRGQVTTYNGAAAYRWIQDSSVGPLWTDITVTGATGTFTPVRSTSSGNLVTAVASNTVAGPSSLEFRQTSASTATTTFGLFAPDGTTLTSIISNTLTVSGVTFSTNAGTAPDYTTFWTSNLGTFDVTGTFSVGTASAGCTFRTFTPASNTATTPVTNTTGQIVTTTASTTSANTTTTTTTTETSTGSNAALYGLFGLFALLPVCGALIGAYLWYDWKENHEAAKQAQRKAYPRQPYPAQPYPEALYPVVQPSPYMVAAPSPVMAPGPVPYLP